MNTGIPICLFTVRNITVTRTGHAHVNTEHILSTNGMENHYKKLFYNVQAFED